jgi:hypothetical protein
MTISTVTATNSSLNPAPAGSSPVISAEARSSKVGESPYSLILDGSDSTATIHVGDSGTSYTVVSRDLQTSIDEGDNWTIQDIDIIPANFSCKAILEASDGSIYVCADYTTGNPAYIYRKRLIDSGFSIVHTIPAGDGNLFSIRECDGGNIIATGRGSNIANGTILTSTNNGDSFTETLSYGAGGANTVIVNTAELNGVLVAAHYFPASIVHTSTDCGVSWSTVAIGHNFVYGCVDCVEYDGRVYIAGRDSVTAGGGVIRVYSSDDPETPASWVEDMPPTSITTSAFGDVRFGASVAGLRLFERGFVHFRNSLGSWGKSATGISSGYDVVSKAQIFDTGSVLLAMGWSTGDGDILRSTAGHVDYYVEKDSVEIAQTNAIALTDFDADDVAEYKILASDDGGTTKTSLGNVSQQLLTTAKSLSFGGESIPFKAGIGYKTEYRLNMHRVVDSLGIIKWVDMYKQHDTFKTSVKAEMLGVDQQTLEEMLKGEYGADVFTAEDVSGFYPFTPFFDYSSGVTFSMVNRPKGKEVNLYGDASQYDFDIIPAYANDIFTDVPAAGVIPDCGNTPENWYITSGLWLPYPEDRFDNVTLNQNNSAAQTNGGYNSTFHVKKNFGEITKIQVEVDEEIARQLVGHFSTVRGGTSEAFFPTGYSPLGHLYPDNNYFTVRLADSTIEFTHTNHRRMLVEFSIQLIGVVS